MRVAIVCPYDLSLPGGVQQVAFDLKTRLVDGGDEAALIGPGIGQGWISVGSSVTLLANRSRVPVAVGPQSWARVKRALADVDVVHIHEPLVPMVGLAALAAGKPTVTTFHADPPPSIRFLYRTGMRLDARMSKTMITAVSAVAASAIPPRWGRPRIIPNAVDVASFAGSTSAEPGLVAFLGRDDRRKGFDVLAAAWPAVLEAIPDARLEVAGFERSEPLPSTTFHGRVSEAGKREMLSRAAVLVAPNLGGESFGIVLVEAMSAGCAIVASELPAFRDVAGGVAEFAQPGNPRALSEAIISLLSDPLRRVAASEAALARAAVFDWGSVLSSYRRAYRQALESG